MDISFPVVAGAVSTTIFAVSALPMLLKAVSTGLMLFWYLRYAVGCQAALGAPLRWVAALNRRARRLGRSTHGRAWGSWAVLPKQSPVPPAHSEFIDSMWRG